MCIFQRGFTLDHIAVIKMKTSVRLKQIDRFSGEEKILVQGQGLLNGNRLLYPESKDAVQSVTFNDEEIILERKADVISRTELRKRGRGKSFIDSEFGRLELETELGRYERNDTVWLVEYRVLSGDEPVLDQILIWEIGPAQPDNR